MYELKNDRGYLIKAIASSFERLTAEFKPVYNFAVDEGYRIQTYPLPDVGLSVEIDLVDAEWSDQRWKLDAAAQILQDYVPDPHLLLTALTETNRSLVMGFLDEHPELLNSVHSEDFIEIVQSAAVGDRRQILRSLSFVPEIENQIRIALWMVLIATDGDWVLSVEALALESGLPQLGPDLTSAPFEDWNLSQLVILMGRLSSSAPGFKATIVELLGTDWRAKIERVRTLRNEISHGRFGGVIDKKGESMREYMNALEVALVLDIYLRNGHNIGVETP